jgi:hypothetical protein
MTLASSTLIVMQRTQTSMSTPSAQSSLPQRGEVFDGRYRVESVIGIDAMGALLAATRLENDERVAIKVLLPDSAPDVARNGAIGRATLQGVGSSKLRGDVVARSAEAGISQGRPYLVLEYPAGMDPRELVDQGGIHRRAPAPPPPPPAFPPARTVRPVSASDRLAAPMPARVAARSLGRSAPEVPMRSAAPGYLLAGMALVAIAGTAGWAVWHQGRALHEAEARTEAPTMAPTVKLPSAPTLPPADSVVMTTGAVVGSGPAQAPSAREPATTAPRAASPAPPPRHHHHSYARPAPAAQSSLTENPYAEPSAPATSSPTDPGAGTGLFDVRK